MFSNLLVCSVGKFKEDFNLLELQTRTIGIEVLMMATRDNKEISHSDFQIVLVKNANSSTDLSTFRYDS